MFPAAATAKYNRRKPALHVACQKDHAKAVVKKLIELTPTILQEPDYEGNYPIHHARNGGSFDNMKTIIDADRLAIQRQNGKGEYPLHLACHHSILQLPKIQVDVRDENGETALHHACSFGVDEAVEKLLQHPDVHVNECNNHNETPLHKEPNIDWFDSRRNIIYAPVTNIGETRVIEPLLQHPFILINEINLYSQTPLDVTIRNIDQLHKKVCRSGATALSRGAYPDRIKQLVQIKELLEISLTKQRWQSYNYMLEHIEDLSLPWNTQDILTKKRDHDGVLKTAGTD